jgi:hypothetical protein
LHASVKPFLRFVPTTQFLLSDLLTVVLVPAPLFPFLPFASFTVAPLLLAALVFLPLLLAAVAHLLLTAFVLLLLASFALTLFLLSTLFLPLPFLLTGSFLALVLCTSLSVDSCLLLTLLPGSLVVVAA